MLQKASRKQAKMKMGIFGPSGSWKTMSALLMAKWMVWDWTKIAIIDTENKSAHLYSHLWDYNVYDLQPPFSPEAYVTALQECEKAWIECAIIDSISHEWEGRWWILEIVEELSEWQKNSFSTWGKVTPRHNAFISAILQTNMHVICCGRSKQDYVLNQKEKNGRIINVPEKVWLKAVTREGFDYEMTIAFDLMQNHYASVSKDRTGVFSKRPEFKITEETWKEILAWNLSWVKEKTTEEIQQENYTTWFEKFTQWLETKDQFETLRAELNEAKKWKDNFFNEDQTKELKELILKIAASFEEKKGDEVKTPKIPETKKVEPTLEEKIKKLEFDIESEESNYKIASENPDNTPQFSKGLKNTMIRINNMKRDLVTMKAKLPKTPVTPTQEGQ